MRGLTASDVLDVCERGRGLGDAGRALILLAAASPEASVVDVGDLPLGARNRGLLELHARTFGERVDGLAACPTCGATLEVSFPVTEPASLDDAPGGRWWPVNSDLGDVRFRLPTGGDLVAIEGIDDPARARRTLIGRCVEVWRDGRRRSPRALPAPLVREVAGRMADEDPDALIDLGVTCPACGTGERLAFDAASYVWTEVEALGARLVREVRVLASAFGWGEAEILALPPSRRNAYLELVAS